MVVNIKVDLMQYMKYAKQALVLIMLLSFKILTRFDKLLVLVFMFCMCSLFFTLSAALFDLVMCNIDFIQYESPIRPYPNRYPPTPLAVGVLGSSFIFVV